MKIAIQLEEQTYFIDAQLGISLAIPVKNGPNNVTAWYAPPAQIKAVQTDQFIGSVELGGSVNFRDIFFNPHANGTHTECLGHISSSSYHISDCLKTHWFLAQVWSVNPQKLSNGDALITEKQIYGEVHPQAKAFIIRTLPNAENKRSKQYSNTNPPYIQAEATQYLVDAGIQHLLIDTPSVDREEDGGALASHHIFWNYPQAPRVHCTISELIYVPNKVEDGLYLLNLQVAAFENDAAPSQPIIYPLLES